MPSSHNTHNLAASQSPSSSPAASPSSTTSTPRTTRLLVALRTRVTAASPDYVGSLTLSIVTAEAARLHHRQLIQVRVLRTAHSFWTYVIVATDPPPLICVNGAAALAVRPGDDIIISAYGQTASPIPPLLLSYPGAITPVTSSPIFDIPHDLLVEAVIGKVHRARVSNVYPPSDVPAVVLDSDWMTAAQIIEFQQVHLVSVTTGRRDVIIVRAAPSGSGTCAVALGHDVTSGQYAQGDVVIIIAFTLLSASDLAAGKAPPLSLCFPVEMPADERVAAENLLIPQRTK